MSTRAWSAVATPTISSTPVAASSRAVVSAKPNRRARSATCCSDSSPVA